MPLQANEKEKKEMQTSTSYKNKFYSPLWIAKLPYSTILIWSSFFAQSERCFSHRKPRSLPASAAIWNCSFASFRESCLIFFPFFLSFPVELNLVITSGISTPATWSINGEKLHKRHLIKLQTTIPFYLYHNHS